MKLVFIHLAEKLKIDDKGNIYTDGSYDMNIWNRYLMLFDTITLVMRKDSIIYTQVDASQKFNIIKSEKISYIFVPDINASVVNYFNPVLRAKRRKIIESQIDISDAVIVRLPGECKSIYYAQKKGKKNMVEVVGDPFFTLWYHSMKGKILALPSFCKLKKTMWQTNYAIYVTKEYLQKKYPTCGKSIGCSDVFIEDGLIFDDSNFKSKDKKEIIIGTAAATNVKFKGQQYVIKALANLKKKSGIRYIYQLAGNGDAKYLKSLVQKYGLYDDVIFLGNVPHNELNNWYRKLDIYIQPSIQEGLPRALIEAMSNSVACIGSNCGGIPELLGNEAIFRKKNVKQLEKKILFLTEFENRLKNAKECFEKSKEYTYSKLNKTRLSFMEIVFKGDLDE